jgi:DHA3 family macrolide efflux protein-like MFS transporter
VSSQGLRTYYTLIVTQTVSLIGSQISSLAVSIWVFKQTHHATPLALVSFFFIIPQIVASGFFGALADRFDRRYLMILANIGFVLCSTLLLVSFLSGAFQLWQLYALTLASSLCGLLDRPAFQASVTMLVPDYHRDRANAIQQITGPTAGVFAPAIAGLLYAAIGVAGSILINLATFAVAIIVLCFLRIPMPAQTAEGLAMRGRIWREAFAGFQYLGARPILLALCAYLSVVNFLVGGIGVLTTPYILARTGSSAVLGLVLGELNLGAVAGALVMSVWGGTRPRIHTIMLGICSGGVFLALSGLAQTSLFLGLTLFLFMFSLPFVNASAMSTFQAKIAPDVQGRVFAAIGQINMLLLPLAYLISGPLADRAFEPAIHAGYWHMIAPLVGAKAGAGIGLMFVIGGASTAIVSLAVYLVPSIRRIEAILPEYVLEEAGTVAE